MREEGCYWIKISDDWEVAGWLKDEWRLTGDSCPVQSSQIREVGPRIRPPSSEYEANIDWMANNYSWNPEDAHRTCRVVRSLITGERRVVMVPEGQGFITYEQWQSVRRRLKLD